MELKKCPFCGGEVYPGHFSENEKQSGFFCQECNAFVYDDAGKIIDTQEDADIKNTKPLSDEDKGMLMHDITNILADNFCTIEDAEDILNGTLRGIRVTSRVERLKW